MTFVNAARAWLTCPSLRGALDDLLHRITMVSGHPINSRTTIESLCDPLAAYFSSHRESFRAEIAFMAGQEPDPQLAARVLDVCKQLLIENGTVRPGDSELETVQLLHYMLMHGMRNAMLAGRVDDAIEASTTSHKLAILDYLKGYCEAFPTGMPPRPKRTHLETLQRGHNRDRAWRQNVLASWFAYLSSAVGVLPMDRRSSASAAGDPTVAEIDAALLVLNGDRERQRGAAGDRLWFARWWVWQELLASAVRLVRGDIPRIDFEDRVSIFVAGMDERAVIDTLRALRGPDTVQVVERSALGVRAPFVFGTKKAYRSTSPRLGLLAADLYFNQMTDTLPRADISFN